MDAELTEAPLRFDDLLDVLADPALGAVVIFVGRVRGDEEGRPIAAIGYEAYAAMAAAQFGRIGRRAGEAHGARVIIRHRTGRVPVQASAVVVAAAAGHRAEAFAAARQAVEDIKADAALWKVSFEPVEAPR